MVRVRPLVPPVNLSGAGAREDACRHEEVVGQAVDVPAARLVHRLVPSQDDQTAFGAAAYGARDVPGAGAGAAAGQDELLERRQTGVEGIESGFERLDSSLVDDRGAGHRKLGPDVEQRVLHVDEGFANGVRQRVGEDHPEIGVQLVEIPHRRDPRGVLGQTAAVGEPGRAVVAGAGIDA